ncbi:iron-containing redox enzyme family protein [Allosphingosinicella sp.]|uniref:iron-containing redox enzyme family protein n=1 Tax=Allosphingosinicella sp. TaxID=2823234 RepID=UPI003783962F
MQHATRSGRAVHPKAELQLAFQQALEQFLASGVMRRIADGDFEAAHYAAVLREIYFYSREDPQLQAFVTAWFKGDDRALVRGFLKHAVSEVGHDQLALADLQALGVETSDLPAEFPLPTTVALTAFPYWAAQFVNPASYLGYLYFLEGLPTSAGSALIGALSKAGIPQQATSFLTEHATVDMAHVRLMDRYVDTLVRSDRDLADVRFAIETTAKLYELMIDGAFAAVDAGRSDFGANLGEKDRLTVSPGRKAA